MSTHYVKRCSFARRSRAPAEVVAPHRGEHSVSDALVKQAGPFMGRQLPHYFWRCDSLCSKASASRVYCAMPVQWPCAALHTHVTSTRTWPLWTVLVNDGTREEDIFSHQNTITVPLLYKKLLTQKRRLANLRVLL